MGAVKNAVFIIIFRMNLYLNGIDLKTIAQRIRKSFVAQDFSSITNETTHISVSIGACQFKPEEAMEAFVKRTDDALYRAKQNGKNRVHPS